MLNIVFQLKAHDFKEFRNDDLYQLLLMLLEL